MAGGFRTFGSRTNGHQDKTSTRTNGHPQANESRTIGARTFGSWTNGYQDKWSRIIWARALRSRTPNTWIPDIWVSDNWVLGTNGHLGQMSLRANGDLENYDGHYMVREHGCKWTFGDMENYLE